MCIRDSCRGADPSPNTRPARSALSQHAVTLPALRFASHSIAPHAASAPRYRLCTIFGASDPLGTISQGIRTGSEPLRKEARLLGPALCQLLSNPQPLFKGGESVIRLSLGRRLVNLSSVAQRTNTFTCRVSTRHEGKVHGHGRLQRRRG